MATTREKIMNREPSETEIQIVNEFPHYFVVDGDHYWFSDFEEEVAKEIGPYDTQFHKEGICNVDNCPYADFDDTWEEQMLSWFKEWNEKDIAEGKEPKQYYCDEHDAWHLEHGHHGVWTRYYLGKTGYDYGFQGFYFKNEEYKNYFCSRWYMAFKKWHETSKVKKYEII